MRFIFLLSLTIGIVTTARAQEIPTTPEDTLRLAVRGDTVDELQRASAQFTSGHWDEFVNKARTIVNRIKQPNPSSDCPAPFVDLKRDYVLLIWAATLPTANDPVLLSAVLHDPAGEPYARVIPGLKGGNSPKLFEVFLTVNSAPSIASYYISKPLPDPLLDQVPAVVDKFLGPLFTSLEATIGQQMQAFAALPEKPELWALIRQVVLPESRAGVEVKVSASLPTSPTTTLNGLEHDLSQRGYAITGSQADALKAAMEAMRAVVDDACKGPARACRDALHAAVTSVLKPRLGSPQNDSQREPLRSLESALHSGIDALKPEVVSGEFTLDNSPLTHLGFGLLSAFASRIYGNDQRVTLDKNSIAAAELPRALQMVVLNWSPWGYQEKTTRRWNRLAFVRPFAGVVFSPDIGISAGVSLMVLSNLGVNVGYAHLFVSTPQQGLEIGADVSEKGADGGFKYSEELRRDPLRAGHLGALFFGVSYNFK